MLESFENGLEAGRLAPKRVDAPSGRWRKILPFHEACVFKCSEPAGQYVRCDLWNSRSQVREALGTFVKAEQYLQGPPSLKLVDQVRGGR
jgi:hypothetical protein